MITRQHLLQHHIDEAIGEYAMLSHPFYQLWAEGKLTQTALAEYARQYHA
jgi:pyrroloquinoline quinone (PQQ) biosynthesis protein C